MLTRIQVLGQRIHTPEASAQSALPGSLRPWVLQAQDLRTLLAIIITKWDFSAKE